jgi:hypothetical protein
MNTPEKRLAMQLADQRHSLSMALTVASESEQAAYDAFIAARRHSLSMALTVASESEQAAYDAFIAASIERVSLETKLRDVTSELNRVRGHA